MAGIGWDSFAWLVAHNMGAAFMLYAQGLLPFLLPLSVLLFEPEREEPQPNAAVPRSGRSNYALHTVGADGIPIAGCTIRGNSIVYINQATNGIQRLHFLQYVTLQPAVRCFFRRSR